MPLGSSIYVMILRLHKGDPGHLWVTLMKKSDLLSSPLPSLALYLPGEYPTTKLLSQHLFFFSESESYYVFQTVLN